MAVTGVNLGTRVNNFPLTWSAFFAIQPCPLRHAVPASLIMAAVLAVGVSAAGVETLDIVPPPGTFVGTQELAPRGVPQQVALAERVEKPRKTEVDTAPVTPRVRQVRVTGISERRAGVSGRRRVGASPRHRARRLWWRSRTRSRSRATRPSASPGSTASSTPSSTSRSRSAPSRTVRGRSGWTRSTTTSTGRTAGLPRRRPRTSARAPMPSSSATSTACRCVPRPRTAPRHPT